MPIEDIEVQEGYIYFTDSSSLERIQLTEFDIILLEQAIDQFKARRFD